MKKINIIFLTVAFGLMQLSANSLKDEDSLIMEAIYYTDKKDARNGAKVWKELFKNTNNEKYLIEYFYTSLQYRDIKDIINELKVTLSQKKSKELYELLAGLYAKEGNTDGLLEVMKDNASDKDVESMYELAYLYTIKGKNREALEIYNKIFKREKSWESLKGILSILSKDGKVDEATKRLWKAISVKNNKMPKEAYLIYVGLIDFKKDTKRAIYAFKNLYRITGNKKYLKELISLYLHNRDYDSVIELLEKSGYDNKLLYELYLSKRELVKAYKLLDILYKKSKNPKWLAEKAILTFEIADSLKAVNSSVIDRVSNLFDKAIEDGAKTPTYYNYYGYTLIDHDRDVEKGVSLVKKALKTEPKNIYYLDSLAWGYFKLNRCKEAKEIMDKIYRIKSKKLENEIIAHQKEIDKCKEK